MTRTVPVFDLLNASHAAMRAMLAARFPGYTIRASMLANSRTAAVSWDFDHTAARLSYTLILPALPADGMLTRAEANLITGFWIHEAGHVIHTDSPAWDAAVAAEGGHGSPRGRALHLLINALEDPRMEAATVASGIARNAGERFATLADHMATHQGVTGPVKDPADTPWNAPHCVPWTLAYTLRALAFGAPLAHAQAAYDATSGAVRQGLDLAIRDLPGCTDTASVITLARQLLDLLTIEDDSQQDDSQGQGQGGQGAPQDSQDSQDSQDDSQGQGQGQGGDEDDEDDEDDSQGQGGDEDDEDDEDGEDDSQGQGGDEDDEDGEDDSQGQGGQGGQGGDEDAQDDEDDSQGQGGPGGAQDAQDAPQDDTDSQGQGGDTGGHGSVDLDALANAESPEPDLAGLSETVCGAHGVDPHTAGQRTTALTSGRDGLNLRKIEGGANEIRKYRAMRASVTRPAKLRDGIRRLVRAPERIQHESFLTRGRVDPRAMSRAMAGREDVYRRREYQPATAAAVTLLIDASGSMAPRRHRSYDGGENRIATATALAIHLAEAIDSAGGSVQVAAFSGGRADRNLMIVKPRNKRVTACRASLGALPALADGGTPLSDCLIDAAQELASVNATRRIVLALTDGGCNTRCVPEATRIANRMGVEVLGLGIGGSAGQFIHGQDVESLDDLARVGLATLLASLKHGARAAR